MRKDSGSRLSKSLKANMRVLQAVVFLRLVSAVLMVLQAVLCLWLAAAVLLVLQGVGFLRFVAAVFMLMLVRLSVPMPEQFRWVMRLFF